ncbi:MAG: dihydropteroate synthase [Kiritimatiellae bacterium]|nr:dihydropteroate synthase [Kiritimatiellia bacterium]MDD5520828.1 dihydropteroate synthase [Kiritimatiellia bacterium]
MKVSKFIIIGENIHCTRILKVGGKSVRETGNGKYAVTYKAGSEIRELPIPDVFMKKADWENGKVKHCAVAVWQGNYGDSAGKIAGADYIQNLASLQTAAGASYLDINVDEFSTDLQEKKKMIKWTVETVQKAVKVPVSIDSSNTEILRAGLEACDKSRGKPMVNSVSLERVDAIETAAKLNAVVIASAAGEKGLPSSNEERMKNIDAVIPKLTAVGLKKQDIHVDPLVFPISTDSNNGKNFLATVSNVRGKYGPEIHIVAGLSNVSFGMPNRKLINQVFSWLAVEAGADGGIVDPMQINAEILTAMDTNSKQFQLAKALLTGEDEFGMNFITAFRGE